MSKFTFTIETDNLDELSVFQNAAANSFLLWELKHNFWRRWKHSEAEGDYRKGIDEVLDALAEELKQYNDFVE